MKKEESDPMAPMANVNDDIGIGEVFDVLGIIMSATAPNAPASSLTNEQSARIAAFNERVRLREQRKEERKMELENLDLLSCEEMADESIKDVILKFKPNLLEFFTERFLVKNWLTIYTSGVVNNRQLLYICREIEEMRPLNEKGTKDDVLHKVAVPFVIGGVFQNFHNFDSMDDAFKRILIQVEKKNLFGLNESF
jgi:hypothetical protein